jgi:(E)-4-hydroxy-3-methylbut-2-enyl-diphosphate synthase
LTEDPEFEIPVAAKLAQKYENILINQLNYTSNQKLDYYHYNKRKTNTINNIGGSNHSIVFGDLSKKNNIVETNLFGLGYSYSKTLDKWTIFDQAIDYLYTGKQEITFNIPGTLRIVTDYDSWQKHQNPTIIPLCTLEESSKMVGGKEYFLQLDLDQTIDVSTLPTEHVTYIITTKEKQKTQKIRRFQHELAKYNNTTPVILHLEYTTEDVEQFQIEASADAGIHFIDGFGDGIWITANHASAVINSLSFGILQATRTRISKTEYISCPSCGRTLFDLQSTTAKIRSRTSHLKGLKIGIMGCIVNGPGEMADADYGYVGTGQGKITLYKEKQVVRKNVPEEEAVDALIDLLKENGDWIEPNC